MFEDPTNADRADWATAGLYAFGECTGQTDYDLSDEALFHEIVGDLLCDLMHLADVVGHSFDAALQNGRRHYDEEVYEESYEDPA